MSENNNNTVAIINEYNNQEMEEQSNGICNVEESYEDFKLKVMNYFLDKEGLDYFSYDTKQMINMKVHKIFSKLSPLDKKKFDYMFYYQGVKGSLGRKKYFDKKQEYVVHMFEDFFVALDYIKKIDPNGFYAYLDKFKY